MISGLHPYPHPQRPAHAGFPVAFPRRVAPCTRLPTVRAFRSPTLLCPLLTSGRRSGILARSLSPHSGTPARPPGVSSPAFGAQPLDLQPEPLMDMGLAVIGPLARLGMPPIQFLFVGSRLCSTLLSDTPSRDRCPCASLRLHLHQVGEGTFTPKLMNMPSTPKPPGRGAARSGRVATARDEGQSPKIGAARAHVDTGSRAR